MSMNFGREQALLRQRLLAKASKELGEQKTREHGGQVTFLGADDAEVAAAAGDLAAAYPQMGRAQMTAFVRTLWQSRIHELRAVGAELLAMRAALLEPPDLPFVETLLGDASSDAVQRRLSADVLGTMVTRHKKLWKELRRLSGAAHERVRLAAVLAAKTPAADGSAAFHRLEELVTPLLADADALLQKAIDELLAAAAAHDEAAVRAFAERHGRKLALPRRRTKAPTAVDAPPADNGTKARKPAASPAAGGGAKAAKAAKAGKKDAGKVAKKAAKAAKPTKRAPRP